MQSSKNAVLTLEDGTTFHGISFGYEGPTAGEVVFNTAMAGYPEALTDPSFEGQILVITYPILGSRSLQREDAPTISCRAVIAQSYVFNDAAESSLADWLKDEKIPAIYNIDTRALAKHLREKGTMLGRITVEGGEECDFYDPDKENLVAKTSSTEVETCEAATAGKTVVLVDCGAKHNTAECLLSRGVRVVCVPWDYDYSSVDAVGVVVSDGPGNPAFADATVKNVRVAMEAGKPVFGIGMGNLILARAAGAEIEKLPFGHRGHNQPVRRAGSNRCYITAQNHGYAVKADTLPAEWEVMFSNLNDGSVEGLRHKSKPFFAVQFNPEAQLGPHDTEFLFDDFIALLK